MKKRFSLDLDATDEEIRKVREFIKLAAIPLKETDLGFIHSDGEVRDCKEVPTNFYLLDTNEDYFAIPEGAEYELEDYLRRPVLPGGSLLWKNNEWLPV